MACIPIRNSLVIIMNIIEYLFVLRRIVQVAWRAGHMKQTRTFRTVSTTHQQTTSPTVRRRATTTPGVLEWISFRQIQRVRDAGSAVLGLA